MSKLDKQTELTVTATMTVDEWASVVASTMSTAIMMRSTEMAPALFSAVDKLGAAVSAKEKEVTERMKNEGVN